ncbi:RIP metalloprotease RseP [Rariglobus hedericola]|uniref:Zinc metalloprotease n=1 Tax=Rariglobus hedericola TaxID=2597822 RepID=A0A556QRB6_9BACT|nr:RIP metalloprotease RseP [Rariglobus hedericola]TSJ79173.1 RIP metalloprotease RseP [Rariglobus hedericola]
MDIFHTLFSSAWSILLVAVFFGGSIFVHELGHFLAARRRGVIVERFSIGFGPKIFSWKGKDGVEYRLSWLPLGGYVALPQLADMRGIEGESHADLKKTPPPNYSTRMIVFGAGAFFNIIFAFALACIIWGVGLPTSSEQATTRIGYVVDTVTTSDGAKVTSPAVEAGLRIGDTVRAIDGHKIETWQELMQVLLTSAGRTTDGTRREAIFTIERDGQLLDLTVHPVLAGNEKDRRVGIAPGYELVIHQAAAGSFGATAGFQPKDRLAALNDTPILNIQTYGDILKATADQPVRALVKRGEGTVTLTIPARTGSKDATELGLSFTTDSSLTYPNPFKQLGDNISMTYRTFASLVNPQSDVGISKLSGPVGIARVFHMAAQADIRYVLWFTILVNVNLAIMNLLPIPVLDGGHMLFATIGKLRGRNLPAQFIATTQSVFMVLLFSMMIYVSFFDVRRWNRDSRAERAEQTAPAEPAK